MNSEKVQLLRLFIAIPGEPSLSPLFMDLIRQLKQEIQGRVTWIKDENFHLTLKFLGEVQESQMESIKFLSQKVIQENSRFSLTFNRLDFFPNLKRPRVIIIRGDNSSSYERLITMLNQELAPIAAPEKEKEIVPHITLGRIKELESSIRAESISSIPFKPFTLEVKEVCLYQSTLTPQGPVYQVIERLPLQ